MSAGQAPLFELPLIFSDGMILQRNRSVPFFGTAKPGTKIEVQLGATVAKGTAEKDGKWRINFPAQKSGSPVVVKLKGELGADTSTITYQNVQFGEVWIASGQSNMEWRLSNANSFAEERANPEPGVHMFTVAKTAIPEPANNVRGRWESANPQSIGRFSAVAYHFAKELHQKLGVPIGIIHTSWGGTPAQAWTSLPKLSADPKLSVYVSNYEKSMTNYPARLAAYQKAFAEWQKKAMPVDPGNKGEADGWATSTFDDSGWKSIPRPGTFTEAVGSEVIGAAWFRLKVNVKNAEGKSATLSLGAIDDNDVTYVNGVKVGSTGSDVPVAWSTPRNYSIPAGLLKEGENVIAIRAVNTAGPGGFTSLTSEMKLTISGGAVVPLAVPCRANLEVTFAPSGVKPGPQPQAPTGPNNPNSPASLYHGMIAPLIPYGIQGAIWYQGESNAGEAERYQTLFPAMIEDWRARWGQGNFSFFFVQLANFMARKEEPVESAWAELREAQSMTLKLPNTGQALAIEIGEATDIHPRNKKDVGYRLAVNALAKTYRMPVVFSGPVYERASFGLGAARLSMKYAENGMKTTDNGKVKGFQIAGEDKKWFWADATIEGRIIVVKSAQVANPVAVRYAWSDNPDVNLVNGENLPACPFRTDNWPGVTKIR